MAYRVELTSQAESDLDEALAHIVEAAPARAEHWLTGLMDAVCSLEHMPHRCSMAPEAEDFERDIRQILYGKRTGVYRILFCVYEGECRDEGVVRVICIRHGARDRLKPQDLAE
jgi:plasmid stabilization system protein ParE